MNKGLNEFVFNKSKSLDSHVKWYRAETCEASTDTVGALAEGCGTVAQSLQIIFTNGKMAPNDFFGLF